MKMNPLWKRLPRLLLSEAGKYLAIFLFMTGTIGFVSGFLVADRSLRIEYDESFEKYNIEDGHFVLDKEADQRLIDRIEAEHITLFEDRYLEMDASFPKIEGTESHLRLFPQRKEINRVDLLDGRMPQKEGEVALDRLYLDNNGAAMGEQIQILDRTYDIVGVVALSDYSTLYQSNNDMLFDATKFGVGVISEELFEELCDEHGETYLHHSYAWKYDTFPENEEKEQEKSESLAEVIATTAYKYDNELTIFIPRYVNNSINFAGNDMGHDKIMMTILLYILVVIMAFIFAVTTSHEVEREATVIGTLRASGYTRGELLRHYMAPPIIVTLIAALVGNVLGYSFFEDVAASMYRGSYSLTHYVSHFSTEAFWMTTILPCLLMILVTGFTLSKSLSYTPLEFMRHNLRRNKNKKAIRLPKSLPFFTRFQIRILLQNMPNYIVLFIGILFAGVLLMFGMLMTPLLSNYGEMAIANKPCDYQYIIQSQKKLDEAVAEPYCVTGLKMQDDFYDPEDISVYGIAENSRFIHEKMPEDAYGVIVTSDFSTKYQVNKGDIINLKEPYGPKIYAFVVRGIMDYETSLNIYMSQESFNEVFAEMIEEESGMETRIDHLLSDLSGGRPEYFFNGYFSDIDLKEEGYLTDDDVASMITDEELTKLSRQMDISMGEMFGMVTVFALVLFALLIFLLTKLILEKNENAISMSKILGYTNREIGSLYLVSTVLVVVLSAILSLAINTGVFAIILRIFMKGFGGWFNMHISFMMYLKMFLLMLGTYLVVAAMQMLRIRKIPMEEALKNVE